MKYGAADLPLEEQLRYHAKHAIGVEYKNNFRGTKRWVYTKTDVSKHLEGVEIKSPTRPEHTQELIETINEQTGMALTEADITFDFIAPDATEIFVKLSRKNPAFVGGFIVKFGDTPVEPVDPTKDLTSKLSALDMNAFTSEDLTNV